MHKHKSPIYLYQHSPVQRSSQVWTGVRVESPRTPATTVWHIPKTASPSLLFFVSPGIAEKKKNVQKRSNLGKLL